MQKPELIDKESIDNTHCPVTDIINLISKKWTFIILRTISIHELVRFNELQELLEMKISPRTLSMRLKELERSKLVKRNQYQNEIPPKVEYSITKMGRDLDETISSLNNWAYKWNFKLN